MNTNNFFRRLPYGIIIPIIIIIIGKSKNIF